MGHNRRGHRQDKRWLFDLARQMPKRSSEKAAPQPPVPPPLPTSASETAPPPFLQSVLGFLEHGFLLTLYGIIGSALGIVYTPALFGVVLLVWGAMHRTGVVSRFKWFVQIPSFILMGAITFGVCEFTVIKIEAAANITKQEIIDGVARKIAAFIPRSSDNPTTAPVVPISTPSDKQPAQDLTLFDFSDIDRGSIMNNTDEPLFVSSIVTSSVVGAQKVESRNLTINQEFLPKVAGSFPGNGGGTWNTLVHKTAEWKKERAEADKIYGSCARAVVFSPDSSELKEFRDSYKAHSLSLPIGEGITEVDYVKSGTVKHISFRCKTVIMLKQGCTPQANTLH